MNPRPLGQAVLETLVYSDLFDQPLRPAELQRFLHGRRIGLADLEAGLANGLLDGAPAAQSGGYLMLAGREDLAAARETTERISDRLLPIALAYGRRMASLPFVRMVGLTGALAVRNAGEAADLDYLVVTEPGRVWTARLFVIALVRWAAVRGLELCPNYFLAADALALDDRTIFTARELAQMVLVSGAPVYDRLRAANAWADTLLPNADGPPEPRPGRDGAGRRSRLSEKVLSGRAGRRLEHWEMARKIRKFSRGAALSPETAFDDRRVQGHFNRYRARTLEAFEQRKREYGL